MRRSSLSPLSGCRPCEVTMATDGGLPRKTGFVGIAGPICYLTTSEEKRDRWAVAGTDSPPQVLLSSGLAGGAGDDLEAVLRRRDGRTHGAHGLQLGHRERHTLSRTATGDQFDNLVFEIEVGA